MLLSLSGSHIHDLVVERDGNKLSLPGVDMSRHPFVNEKGEAGESIGLNFASETLSFGGKLKRAWNQSLDTVRMVRLSLNMLFSGQAGLKDMSGPVGIVQQMSIAADSAPNALLAVMNLLYFGGFIAINLAVMNLLPIPALDGGRVVCLLLTVGAEAITGKKINPKYEGWLHSAGMMLLLGLMAVIMFKDIFVLFWG